MKAQEAVNIAGQVNVSLMRVTKAIKAAAEAGYYSVSEYISDREAEELIELGYIVDIHSSNPRRIYWNKWLLEEK